MTEWVVILELQKSDSTRLLQLRQLEELVEKLNEWRPSAIFNPDRYALQLRILAPQPSEAFSCALVYHSHAAASLDLPAWPVVRAEVLTPDELEREVAYQQRTDALGSSPPASTRSGDDGADALYEATRELLRVQSPAEATQVLTKFVHRMGGVVVTENAGSMSTLPIDLSFGQGRPMFAAVESFTVSQLRLQELLPCLVRDAEEAICRFRNTARMTDPTDAFFEDSSEAS